MTLRHRLTAWDQSSFNVATLANSIARLILRGFPEHPFRKTASASLSFPLLKYILARSRWYTASGRHRTSVIAVGCLIFATGLLTWCRICAVEPSPLQGIHHPDSSRQM